MSKLKKFLLLVFSALFALISPTIVLIALSTSQIWILAYYILLLMVTLVGFILGVDSHFYEKNGLIIGLENFLLISLIVGLFSVFKSEVRSQAQSLLISISVFLAIYFFIIKTFSHQQVYKLLLVWYSSTLLLIVIALIILIFSRIIPWFNLIFIPVPIFFVVKMLKLISSHHNF